MQQSNFQLVTHILCPYVQRSIILLQEKGIRYQRSDIDLSNKPDWFNQLSPLGKVPVLRVGPQRALFESTVICEYLDEVTAGSLHPEDKLDKAYHRAWIEFGSSILQLIAQLYKAPDKQAFMSCHEQIQQKFLWIEQALDGGKFFAGEVFHLIDAVYAPVFRYFDVFDCFCALNTFENLPKVTAWRAALKQRESVKQAVAKQYPSQLLAFLTKRNSYISQLITRAR